MNVKHQDNGKTICFLGCSVRLSGLLAVELEQVSMRPRVVCGTSTVPSRESMPVGVGPTFLSTVVWDTDLYQPPLKSKLCSHSTEPSRKSL